MDLKDLNSSVAAGAPFLASHFCLCPAFLVGASFLAPHFGGAPLISPPGASFRLTFWRCLISRLTFWSREDAGALKETLSNNLTVPAKSD
jgi:hypothetical protein